MGAGVWASALRPNSPLRADPGELMMGGPSLSAPVSLGQASPWGAAELSEVSLLVPAVSRVRGGRLHGRQGRESGDRQSPKWSPVYAHGLVSWLH